MGCDRQPLADLLNRPLRQLHPPTTIYPTSQAREARLNRRAFLLPSHILLRDRTIPNLTQSANVLYDYAMTNLQTTGEQTRYVELRYEGERVINGTLMRYGDTAEFPWGDKERFEPGCFGDIGKVDFTLDKQHERGRTMARTGGGGVTLNDSLSTLEMRADLPNTTDANDTLELVRAKVLRGLSITFRAIDYGLERNKDGSTTIVHKRAELRGGGVVDRPQYKQSTLREQVRGMVEMEDTQVRALVAELLAQNRQDPKPEPVPAEAIAAAVSAEVKTRFEALDLSGVVSTAVEESLSKRALAEEAAAAVVAAEAEVAKAAAEAAAAAADARRRRRPRRTDSVGQVVAAKGL